MFDFENIEFDRLFARLVGAVLAALLTLVGNQAGLVPGQGGSSRDSAAPTTSVPNDTASPADTASPTDTASPAEGFGEPGTIPIVDVTVGRDDPPSTAAPVAPARPAATSTTTRSGDRPSPSPASSSPVPAPGEPTPTVPAAGKPAPDKPAPAKPTPAEPTADKPAPRKPAPTEPPSVQPSSTVAPTPAPTVPASTVQPAPSPTAPARPTNGDTVVWRLTRGSGGSTEMFRDSEADVGDQHGVRVYCPVSHFSHDDPVVFPGQPGAAHAHMFWGNTESDAYSTGDSLLASGNSSCEGGINNRSSYWMPALYNASGEVVIPERIFVYYKSFGGPGFDRNTIRPIPNGLEMLANRQVRNAGDYHFKVGGDGSGVEVAIVFPNCVALDRDGRPVLRSSDSISHLAYAAGSSSSGCPASHPYRIPTVSYNVRFAVPMSSDWSLSSDHHGMAKGMSLHADYIAAWDPASMAIITDCNIRERRSCEFSGGATGAHRGQLPERFLGPDGTAVYRNSVELAPGADRTPFGSSIPKFAR